MFTAQFGGYQLVRLRSAAALLVGFAFSPGHSMAQDEWGGSAALSSDYFVRGISRTSDHPALQLDYHYASPGGFAAGVFASNSQIDPSQPDNPELSAFVGYGWNFDGDWRARILASHYAYPWNRAGSHYNYDEIDLDLAYQSWLHLSLGYSPNSPRFLARPYERLIGVREKSAEISAQRQIYGRLSLTAGVGYSFLDGPDSGGYAYGSAGAAFDLGSLTFAVAYVKTTAEAKALFYNAAASGRWTGTVLWRF